MMTEKITSSFIKALHDGELNIAMRYFSPQSEVKDLSIQLAEASRALLDTFSPEQEELFEAMYEIERELENLNLLDRFMVGFRLGGQCIYDVFLSTDTPWTPN